MVKYPATDLAHLPDICIINLGVSDDMKHEETTLRTKKALAAALKRFMVKKPLSKITVSEIIRECDLNRKTFYYHFEDIFALLKWMLEEEAVDVVRQFDLMVNTEEAILFVLDYVNSNKHILNCAYDSMGREGLKRFFYADFIGILKTVIDRAEQELGINLEDRFKTFVAAFYTEALAGMLIDLIRSETPQDRDETVRNIELICHSSIPATLSAKAAEANTPGNLYVHPGKIL